MEPPSKSGTGTSSSIVAVLARLVRGAREVLARPVGAAAMAIGLASLAAAVFVTFTADVPLSPFDEPGWFEQRETNGFLRLGGGPAGDRKVAFDDDHLCSAGSAGLWWSQSGGRRWEQSRVDSTAGRELAASDVTTLTMRDPHAWLAAGRSIWKSDDRGRSWRYLAEIAPEEAETSKGEQAVPSDRGSAVALSFGDAEHGCATTGGRLLHTEDGGASWTTDVRPAGLVTDLEFAAAGEAHAIADGALLTSTDGGRTWVGLPSVDPVLPRLTDVAFGADGYGCAIGDDTVLIRANSRAAWVRVAIEGEKLGNFEAVAVNRSNVTAVLTERFIAIAAAGGTGWDLFTRRPSPDDRLVPGISHLWWDAILDTGIAASLVKRDGPFRPQSSAFGATSLQRLDRLHGNAALGFGIVTTDDGGRTWVPIATNALTMVACQQGDALWAGGSGLVRRGASTPWATVQVPEPGNGVIFALSFGSDGSGIAIGDTTAWHSSDGVVWQEVRTANGLALARVDDRHAFTAGGPVFETTDGGRSWQERAAPADNVTGIAIAGAQPIVVTGSGDKAHVSRDAGKTWTPAALPETADWFAVELIDALHGWIAGTTRLGTVSPLHLAFTTDGGSSWTAAPVPDATAVLPRVAFADKDHGWVTAQPGMILRTEDGGRTWQAPAYSVHPPAAASLFALLGATALGLAFWRTARATNRRASETHAPATTVGVSDAAVARPAEDRLDRFALARSLALFLQNRGTRPPLTVAITGAWGSGKSSVMRMLEHELRRARFQPIWFNAWHHENESQFYGALLEAIRQQGMPPWHSVSGLVVRSRLVAQRLWRPVFVAGAVLGTALLVLNASYGLSRMADEARAAWATAEAAPRRVVAEDFATPAVMATNPRNAEILRCLRGEQFTSHDALADRLVAFHTGRDTESVARELAVAIRATAPPPVPSGTWWQSLAGTTAKLMHSEPGTLQIAGGLGLLLAVVLPLLRALTTFGAGATIWFGWLRRSIRTVAIESDPGLRYRLARALDQICAALGSRPLIVFVDDLDRCSPARQMQMLEMLNFLSTGERRGYFVLGAALEVVVPSIAGEVAATVKENTERPTGRNDAEYEELLRVRRQQYARDYLEKMIAIEVHVDTKRAADLAGLHAVSSVKPAAANPSSPVPPPSRRDTWTRLQRPLDLLAIPLLCLIGVVLLAFELRPSLVRAASPRTTVASASTTAPEAPSPGVSSAPPKRPDEPAAVADRRAALASTLTRTRELAAPRSDASSLWIGFGVIAAICIAMILWLFNVLDVRDPEVFRRALVAWTPVLGARTTTPRHVKRVANQIRLLSVRALLHGRSDSDGLAVSFTVMRALRELIAATGGERKSGRERAAFADGTSLLRGTMSPSAWLTKHVGPDGTPFEPLLAAALQNSSELASDLSERERAKLLMPGLDDEVADLFDEMTAGIVLR